MSQASQPGPPWPPQHPQHPQAQQWGPPPGWVVAPGDGWAAPAGYAPDGRPLGATGRRFGGLLLDGLVWAVPMVAMVVLMVVALVAGAAATDEVGGEISGGYVALMLLSYAGIFGVLLLRLVVEAELLHRHGATWGMRWTGLVCVDVRTGQPPSRGKAWGRTLFASFVSGQVLAFGYWWALFDDRKRTLHDLVCGTVVVDARGRP